MSLLLPEHRITACLGLALQGACSAPAPTESGAAVAPRESSPQDAPGTGGTPTEEAETVVRSFHRAWREGDLPAVHGHVDYRHRLDEVLGDLWRQGPPQAQAAMVHELEGMLERTTHRLGTPRQGAAPLELETSPGEGGALWVAAEAPPVQGQSLVWRYRLHRGPGGWKITRREAVVGDVETDTTRVFTLVLAHVTQDLGHPPTLGELVRELPGWRNRIRQRSTRLRLPGAQRRRASVPAGAP